VQPEEPVGNSVGRIFQSPDGSANVWFGSVDFSQGWKIGIRSSGHCKERRTPHASSGLMNVTDRGIYRKT
jgi:hypothetical protein